MLKRRALHDGFGDDSGRYVGAGSISASLRAIFTQRAIEQFIFSSSDRTCPSSALTLFKKFRQVEKLQIPDNPTGYLQDRCIAEVIAIAIC
jgi:hypothetical protein